MICRECEVPIDFSAVAGLPLCEECAACGLAEHYLWIAEESPAEATGETDGGP